MQTNKKSHLKLISQALRDRRNYNLTLLKDCQAGHVELTGSRGVDEELRDINELLSVISQELQDNVNKIIKNDCNS